VNKQQEERELTIRRILVALDASPHSLAALEAAVDLAARLRAELSGLFVEDVNLLRLAGSPFAQEIGFFSATRRRLDAREIERQLRAQASRARQALQTIAERAQVRWSFRVARGVIGSELLTAASEVDLIILGRGGWSLTRRRRLGSTARAVLSESPCLTLILQHKARLEPPVIVVYDGSPLAHKALSAATALVQKEDGYLTVLVLADGPDTAHRLRAQAAEWLQGRRVETRYRLLTESSVPRLTHVMQREGGGTLVLPASSSLLQEEALLALLDEIETPVLLVR
jgi:nucleotide-binding universal stress UspA family protein